MQQILKQNMFKKHKNWYLSAIYFNEYHPIYTENGFHSLTNHNGYDTLVIGDNVKTNNGWSKIIDIKTYQVETPIITYNLAIKDLDEDKDDDTYDTFIVNSAVVHNAACPT